MSAETISPELDRLSDSSTVVGVDKTREEYLKLFSRASYSPQYDRPYSSPVSGFYNAVNTSTSLLLLNHRFKNSHLREQVLPEEFSNPSQKEFDYESIIVTEKPKSKPKPLQKRLSTPIPIDPYRHFGQTKYWHNRRCTSSCLIDNSTEVSHTEPNIPTRSRTPLMNPRRPVSVTRRSQSAFVRKDKYRDEPQSFSESFCQYCRDVVEKSKQSELALQQYPIKELSDQRLKSSGIRRKVPLTKGQQVYLLGKYHIYDIKESKARRTNSYTQLLSNHFKADFHCKPQFRLTDPREYFKYAKFLQAPRSLTPNSFSTKPTDNKNNLTNNNSRHQSFIINNNNKTPITVHVRQQTKPITAIPIQS